jgi:hypothetical protein
LKAADYIPAPLLKQGQAAVARVDAMPQRERLALFCAVLALLCAAEALWVMPMRSQRQNIGHAAAQQAQSEADAAAEAEQTRAQQQTDLEERLAKLDAELMRLGAGESAGKPLGFLLTQGLVRQGVQVVGLRELAVEDIDTLASAGAEAAAAAPAPAASDAAAPMLYRHRFELTLDGTPDALIAAVRNLDRDARPLRIERVRMAAHTTTRSAEQTADPAPGVRATVTLAVISNERTWLSI